jgi:hypothetical protein
MGMKAVSKDEKRRLSISNPIRLKVSDSGKTIEVGIEKGRSKKMQLNMVADALHLRSKRGNAATGINVKLANCDGSVGQEIERLRLAARGVKLSLDRKVEKPSDSLGEKYAKDLSRRLGSEMPDLLRRVDSAVDQVSFQTYRGLSSGLWDARVFGLVVLKLDRNGEAGTIEVGGSGGDIFGNSTAARARRSLGLDASENGFRFPKSATPKPGYRLLTEHQAISKIKKLCSARNTDSELGVSEREHKLEAQVIAGLVQIRVDGKTLEPTEVAKQFPTKWSNDGRARYLDALMKSGDKELWAIELKVSQGGKDGMYLRHGIPQAALYRDFIRNDKAIRRFFKENLGIDSANCQAVLAFPKFDRYQEVKNELESVAAVFDVKLVELDAPGLDAVTKKR